MAPAPDPAAGRGLRVSAPGKVMLAGEYAVLSGARAVVVAVDRRVVARLATADEPIAQAAAGSPFLQAARAVVAAHLAGDPAGDPAGDHGGRAAAPRDEGRVVVVDSGALQAEDGAKLGLGSSAAVTVAACACELARRGAGANAAPGAEPGGFDRALVHALAHRAHGDAQSTRGARGSGTDIAASVHGGIAAVRMRSGADGADGVDAGRPVEVAPLRADDYAGRAHFVFVWTEAPASTPQLVAQVHAWRERQPVAYQRAMAAIADASEALLAALAPSPGAAGQVSGHASDVVRAVAAGARAAAALGDAAGVAIETESHRAIAALAAEHGGAAKPTGAGGGDIALAAFAEPEAAARFRQRAAAASLRVLDLRIDSQGVCAHRPQRA
ncbi:phosphomevalonate kinase [Haliangium ochraceum]|uniref:phosphomevalonate kinase n=1 Tax=Haliangium ochraceum (strain DSM 14365 / JCM 11303 / SMP-2) TaxID=502025 RepID=D0LV68_HALO1|nr:phosphomevalonate kinase [Haliangium ochraceum]ACY15909.1 phosphomevalonate kinase [Haliangium ochraceum DSM 14365]